MRIEWTVGWLSNTWPRLGLRRMAGWLERWRQRRALADLDERLLRDIGLNRAQAAREIDKPFWLP